MLHSQINTSFGVALKGIILAPLSITVYVQADVAPTDDSRDLSVGDFNLPLINWDTLTSKETKENVLLSFIDSLNLKNISTHSSSHKKRFGLSSCFHKIVKISH